MTISKFSVEFEHFLGWIDMSSWSMILVLFSAFVISALSFMWKTSGVSAIGSWSM